MTDVVVVYITAPDMDAGRALARALVDERLAACCNLIPGVRSIYEWEGRVVEEGELMLVVKTLAGRVAALTERVLALHPYSVPEVIALPVLAGNMAYIGWVAAGAAPADPAPQED